MHRTIRRCTWLPGGHGRGLGPFRPAPPRSRHSSLRMGTCRSQLQPACLPACCLPCPRRYGHTDVMEALLRHGAKAGMPNKQELMPMGCALVGGHIAAAKLLQG